jgi:hypothetical protein
VNESTWRCFDEHGCAARHQARKDTNPIWRMVHAARVHSAIVNKQKRLMRAGVQQQIDPSLDEGIDRLQDRLDVLLSARAKRSYTPRKKKDPKPAVGKCECCGDPTKGGRFLPGHDAKLGSRLVGEVTKSGSAEAYAELKRRNWLFKLPAKVRDEWAAKEMS